jgi:hypothetical protein
MTRILATSKPGYNTVQFPIKVEWCTPASGIFGVVPDTKSPLLSASFKSPVVRGDFRHPYDYTRMIGKVTPGGIVDLYTKSRSHRYWGQTPNTIGLLGLTASGCNYSNGSVSIPSWMEDQVIASARTEINQIGMNVYEDLAEASKTGNMIANIFVTIVKLFLMARQGRWKAIRRALKEKGHTIPRHVANGWLMYFYGIKPLVNSMRALANSQSEPIFRTMKVRKRNYVTYPLSSYVTSGPGYTVSGSVEASVQCQLEASIKMDTNMRASTYLGFTEDTGTDLILTGWALLPYSFVVDWFIPVSAWIRSLTWSSALSYQGGFVGRRHKGSGSILHHQPLSITSWEGSFPTATAEIRMYARKAYAWVIPSAGTDFRLYLNAAQVTSAVALLTK